MRKLFSNLLVLGLLALPAQAEVYHLHPANDPLQYTDVADYPVKPADRPGFVWKKGQPPANAKPYQVVPLSERLDAPFKSLPLQAQAQFYPLKAAVKLALEQGEYAVAAEIVRSAQVPASLEPVRARLLQLLEAP